MTESKHYLPWPGADDRIVVEEMLRDRRSGQWYECREFVKRLVQAQAKNIPQDLWDDLVQDTMIRVDKSLLTFHYQCRLRTWIFIIVRSCIVDARRKFKRVGQFMAPLGDPLNENDYEDEGFALSEARSAEDVSVVNDELRNATAALLEYTNTHSNQIRDQLIIRMVIFEGHTHMEAAKAVGCNAPVVGYVVRQAQRYVREMMGYRL